MSFIGSVVVAGVALWALGLLRVENDKGDIRIIIGKDDDE